MYKDFQRQDTFSSEQPPRYSPDDQAAMCVLQYLSKDELNDFNNNPDKLNAYIADLDQVKKISRDRENISVKNRSLAEYNLSRQPILEDLKQQLAISYEEVNRLKFSLAKDIAKLDALPGSQSQETMLAIFQAEAAQADEQSEELADEFIDGKLDVDSFLSDYVQKRTKSYEKRAKLEKLGDLFRQGAMNTSTSPYPLNSSNPNSQTSNTAPSGYNTTGYNSAGTGYSSSGTGYSSAGYGVSGAPYPSNSYNGMPMPYYQR